MAQTGLAEAYVASGWCARCGYKRSAEGNCPNCDRWYTHPLLTIGGPITLSLMILLLVGIRSLRDADPGFARFQNGLWCAAPMPAFLDPNPARPTVAAAPIFFSPANPGTAPIVPVEISRAEKQLADLEGLRESVHTAERGYRTGIPSESSGRAETGTLRNVRQAETQQSAIIL